MSKPNRDDEHLQALRDYYAANRRIPSLQRIASLLGFSSRSAAVKLMGRLADEGFFERTPDDDAWIPVRRFFERNMIDSAVPAGMPVPVIVWPAPTINSLVRGVTSVAVVDPLVVLIF